MSDLALFKNCREGVSTSAFTQSCLTPTAHQSTSTLGIPKIPSLHEEGCNRSSEFDRKLGVAGAWPYWFPALPMSVPNLVAQ
jgi:hypothetical protein